MSQKVTTSTTSGGGGGDTVIGTTQSSVSTLSGGQQKESILELGKMMDSIVRVKCLGGRELQGILRGYDDLVNLVLDECDEYIRDPETLLPSNTNQTRKLGLVVVRGTQVSLVSPQEGVEEISNPFLAVDDEEDDAE